MTPSIPQSFGTAYSPCIRAALGCRRMERLGQAAKAGAEGSDLLHPPRQLGQRAAQAVQPEDYQHIARAQTREQVAQPGLLAVLLGGDLVFHNVPASRFGQRPPLHDGVGVIVGTDPEIADQHGAAPRRAAGFGPGLWQPAARLDKASCPPGPSLPSALTFATVIDGTPVSLHM